MSPIVPLKSWVTTILDRDASIHSSRPGYRNQTLSDVSNRVVFAGRGNAHLTTSNEAAGPVDCQFESRNAGSWLGSLASRRGQGSVLPSPRWRLTPPDIPGVAMNLACKIQHEASSCGDRTCALRDGPQRPRRTRMRLRDVDQGRILLFEAGWSSSRRSKVYHLFPAPRDAAPEAVRAFGDSVPSLRRQDF